MIEGCLLNISYFVLSPFSIIMRNYNVRKLPYIYIYIYIGCNTMRARVEVSDSLRGNYSGRRHPPRHLATCTRVYVANPFFSFVEVLRWAHNARTYHSPGSYNRRRRWWWYMPEERERETNQRTDGRKPRRMLARSQTTHTVK